MNNYLFYLLFFLLNYGFLHYLCEDIAEITSLSKSGNSSSPGYINLTISSTESKSPLGENVKKNVESLGNVIKRSRESTSGFVREDDENKMTDAPGSEQVQPWFPDERPRKLPLSIIITAPTVAVCIMLFLCFAFYFHNAQLNKKAEKISLTLLVKQQTEREENAFEDNTIPSLIHVPSYGRSSLQTERLSRDSSIQNLNGLLPRNYSTVSFRTSRDPDFFYQQNYASTLPRTASRGMATIPNVRLPRNSSSQNFSWTLPMNNSAVNFRNLREPDLGSQQRRSIISLGLPTKGSTLSAYADQEIAYQSAKRKHSVFIL